MTEHQVLEEAIATLRKHRSVLGETVVETAVSALQDQMSLMETTPLIQQFEVVTVLQADLSGFTAMSARLDAEQVRDALQSLWQRLDNVVLSWGGQIEQHTGDGLIALFGVPLAQEDDAQRAVLAALDMQLELALFNEAVATPTDTSPLGQSLRRTDFRMRIGVHSGPVLWGRVGQSLEQTAVGDTMQIVGRLEKLCPVDGVLVSYEVYRQIFGLFEVELGTPLPMFNGQKNLAVYVIKGEKSRAFQTMFEGVMGLRAGFVGRIPELERLEFALQETLENGVMQLVTIAGEAGMGKSRLFDEFERWLEMMPVQGCLLRASHVAADQAVPYGTLRHLLMDYFEIHERSTLPVVLEKFSRGIARISRTYHISVQEQAHVMGQLLGFDFSNSPFVKNLHGDSDKLKRYGLQDLARFFTDLSAQFMPVVILVEDAQWADEESLTALDYLLEACYDLPILVVCLARPELLAKRPLWDGGDDPLSPYLTLPLPPLSAIDGRHMVADLLAELRHVPFKLSDLVVYGAKGNPYYIEHMVHLFYDDGVIQQLATGDNVNLGKLEDLAVPDDLPALFQARVACLPVAEKQVIEAASVVGSLFWDDAIQRMLLPETDLSAEDFDEALSALEQKALIVRRRSSMIAGLSEFSFVHDMLQDAVYAQVVQSQRTLYHARIADWLVERMKNQRLSFYAPMIAAHYQEAGQLQAAAQWSESA